MRCNFDIKSVVLGAFFGAVVTFLVAAAALRRGAC